MQSHIIEEWRIRDVEQKAEQTSRRLYELDSLRGDVARLECSAREICACIDGLRAALDATLDRVSAGADEMTPTQLIEAVRERCDKIAQDSAKMAQIIGRMEDSRTAASIAQSIHCADFSNLLPKVETTGRETPTPRTDSYGEVSLDMKDDRAISEALQGWGILCAQLERELTAAEAKLLKVERETREMTKGDEIVGHKTFINPDGMTFRHEPLTRAEGDALIAAVEAAEAKRAADMPTDQDAVNALWEAQYRLQELGWRDPAYAHDLKKEGLSCQLIELGSSGIHEGYYHPVNNKDVWWSGPEGSPIHPVLVKAKP